MSLRHIFFAAVSLSLMSCMTTKREEEMQGSIVSLEKKVDALENQLKDRSKSIDSVRSESQNVTRFTQNTKSEIEELKRDLDLTKGNVDELRVKFGRLQEGVANTGAQEESLGTATNMKPSEIEENIAGMGRRLAKVEASIAALQDKAAPSHGSSSKKNEKQGVKFKKLSELKSAVAKSFNKKDYKKVIATTTSVLSDSSAPKNQHEYALYIRAEANFAEQKYEDAAHDFTLYIEKYPQGDKVPRALLLSGDSYVYLKQSLTAKTFYSDCVKSHPEKAECKASKERLGKM